MDEVLRWNYSPLKEKAAQVAGWPFRFGGQFSVLDSQFWVANDRF